jgi:iron-sulfur cluster assembly accessory protein
MQTPQLKVTESALLQIKLIQQHDYTLSDLTFRIKIGGKGCGGFTYETGFSEKRSDDVIIEMNDCVILMDPFTAFYTQDAELDFAVDSKNNEDGFVIHNNAGNLYAGKFYKDTTLIPPWETK